jgi:hypothetical protein
MSTCSTSIFKDPNVAKHLSLLHDKYVTVSADKAPNTIVFVCKSHYIDCLIKELGIHNSLSNGSRYLGPLANTSHREVLLIILRSPVIMWPVGLYMNEELAQVQSGGL